MLPLRVTLRNMRPKRYESSAEKQKAYRERKARAEAYAKEFPEVAKMEAVMTDEAHPVYPELKKYSDRTYDEGGLVLFSQRCEKCNGLWSASIAIPCPYCKGTGKRVHQ